MFYFEKHICRSESFISFTYLSKVRNFLSSSTRNLIHLSLLAIFIFRLHLQTIIFFQKDKHEYGEKGPESQCQLTSVEVLKNSNMSNKITNTYVKRYM